MSWDVIVVLGAAVEPDGRLGPALEERVQAAVRAFLNGMAPRLLVTGAAEAEAMRARAVELGVPPGAILVEPSARSTRENALRSAEILRRERLGRALVVTQPYHQRRSVGAFRRVGVEAEPLHGVGGYIRFVQRAREVIALAVYATLRWI